MKNTNGPLRLFGKLFKDIFNSKKSNKNIYGWCRFPINVKSKYEQNKVLRKITKSIKEKQIIKNDNKKR
tara:strand:+ start:63 stop:269 length:207 start_codon:yes stop_codon:yes gene_type:complete